MLRADWRSWRFWRSSTALRSHSVRELRVEVVDIMSSAFVFLWVKSFLGVIQALLMIDFSSIIVFPFALHSVLVLSVASCNITRPAYIVNLPFTTHESHTRADELRSFQIHHRPFG